MNEDQSNPNMEKKCPQCGAALPSGALAGLCPACLLKQGAAAETGARPEPAPFQPPTVSRNGQALSAIGDPRASSAKAAWGRSTRPANPRWTALWR